MLIKNCSRCERRFDLPNIRISPARETLILCYPCPHCGFSECSANKGRCADCSIPFDFIDHNAKGLCNRCYMRKLRAPQKAGGLQ